MIFTPIRNFKEAVKMIKKREKSVLKNLNLKNTLFSLFYNGLMEIYFTPDFIEPKKLSFLFLPIFNNLK